MILEEEELNEIYFIESGHVAAFKDEEKIVDFFAKEDVLGLANLLLDSKSEYSFQVISNELIVTKYEKSDIIEKVINTQEGYFYHYVHMQNQVERMIEKEALLRLPSEQRISLALFQIVTKFGESTGKQHISRFPKQISKGMIAQYTSMNPNTITNVIQKLEEEEIIHPLRRTIHVDMSKLEMKLKEML
ncbi:Crp/Fnr family transcriptional regulator [Listeria grandensis]|uniref:Crp/Fnr family transcriptional regulator n=1 Tax=Listeria grandensis TaxID=1494963 RepID=UPI0011EA5699